VGEEGLLVRPSDLRFWHPTGIGFLTKHVHERFLQRESRSSVQYLVTNEFIPKAGMRGEVFDVLRTIATAAQEDDSVLTFWVQDRFEVSAESVGNSDDETVYVLLRCRDRSRFDEFVARTAEWKTIGHMSEARRTTTWIDSGIGFIGR
jgi:hypothetical protein